MKKVLKIIVKVFLSFDEGGASKMDKEKAFWEEQLRVYNSLPYNNSEKYYNWQPARFAGNKAAILLMKNI